MCSIVPETFLELFIYKIIGGQEFVCSVTHPGCQNLQHNGIESMVQTFSKLLVGPFLYVRMVISAFHVDGIHLL